jgi:hypothetical protein
MSILMQSISNLINKEVFKLAQKINEDFPQIPANAVLEIWKNHQEIHFDNSRKEQKTCQHIYT